jgi:perosamine synthetase
VHREVGYNYRLTNLQAALGCAQLESLDAFVEAKRGIAARYAAGLSQMAGVRAMAEAPWAEASFWLYTIELDPSLSGVSSRDLMRALEEVQIQTRSLWQPLHQSPAHAKSFARPCSVAERVNQQALSLPSSSSLTVGDQSRVIDAICRILATGMPLRIL